MDENETLADPLVRRDTTPGFQTDQREQNLAQREQNLTEDKSRFATKTDIFEKTAGRYLWYAGMIVLVLVALGLATGALVKETSSVSSLEAAVSATTSTNLGDQQGIKVTKSGTTSILGLDFTDEDSNLRFLYVTPGTAEAKKALVLDANKGISGVSTLKGVSLIEAETINVENFNYSLSQGVSNNFRSGELGSNQFESSGNGAINSGIIGGNGNTNIGASCFIGGGSNNNIEYGVSESCIIGGTGNILDLSPGEINTSNVIIGGRTNRINDNTVYSVIIGGSTNRINDEITFSTINGGLGNLITGVGNYSGINSGLTNYITGPHSFIGGGKRNGISGSGSGIIGGTDNRVDVHNSVILGGNNNEIKEVYNYNSVILGGNNNQIKGGILGIGGNAQSAIIGGTYNIIEGLQTEHSVILGGSSNGISGSYNPYSAIIGGRYNSISGSYNYYSAILAGNNNTITGTGSSQSVVIGGEDHKIEDSENCCIAGGVSLITSSGGTSYENSLICGQYNNPIFFPWDQTISPDPKVPGNSFRFSVGTGTDDTNNSIGFAVDNVGNIYYGTTDGCSIYRRTGATSYEAKAFTIQHPTDPGRWLRHGCLEGPEAGVYYRGKDTAPTTIKLPEYAPKIASNFTVQITPIGEPRMISSSEVSEEGSFQVFGEGKFHWHVTGTRLEMEIEPLKKDITIKNFGPYSWSE